MLNPYFFTDTDPNAEDSYQYWYMARDEGWPMYKILFEGIFEGFFLSKKSNEGIFKGIFYHRIKNKEIIEGIFKTNKTSMFHWKALSNLYIWK